MRQTPRNTLSFAVLVACFAILACAQEHGSDAAKPKVLLLYDMEGISGIDRQIQCDYPTPEYQQARRLLTADVNAAIRGLKAGGAGEIVVIDGHGSGNWIEPDIILADMDDRAAMGWRETPYDPYVSPDSSFNAIVSIGAHAGAGTTGFLAHTRSRNSVYKVNGVELTETSIIALAGARFGIPVIMVSGDDVLQEHVRALFPGAEYALVKRALSVRSAELLPVEVAHANIERAAEAAIRKLGSLRPLFVGTPFNFELIYRNKTQADQAARYPGTTRINSITMGYTTSDVVEGIGIGRRMSGLADQESRSVLIDIIRKRPDGQAILDEWRHQLDERWYESVHEEPTPNPPLINTLPTAKPGDPPQFWGDF